MKYNATALIYDRKTDPVSAGHERVDGYDLLDFVVTRMKFV